MQAGAVCLEGGGEFEREFRTVSGSGIHCSPLGICVGIGLQARVYVLYPCHPQASLQFLAFVIAHFPESAGPSNCGDSPLCDQTPSH